MEDFAEKISEILNDEESMKQLGEIAQMLGFTPDGAAPSPAPLQSANSSGDQGINMPDIGALMAVAGKLKEAGGEDDNIHFLSALRPLLSEEKRPRIDRAIKILKLINLLPVLRDSGILGGDLLGIL